ncbi:MAG TPA: hypothetical protein VG841_09175 [Caulobacterales bacterium]|nr:hypothetical protein [Caulobacterales bacterium]
MTTRLWPLATAVFGALTLLIVVAFGLLPSVRAAHFAQGDFTAALALFQRAVTPADLNAVFGDPADQGVLDAMTAGNRLDLFGFIPTYTLFLASGAAMLAGGFKRALVWLALAPLLVGTAADIVETSTQLAMTADYANASAHLPVAPWCWSKYFGLAFGSLGAAAICVLSARKRFILAALSVLPLPAAIMSYVGAAQVMNLAFGAAWVGLLVIGTLELFRKP